MQEVGDESRLARSFERIRSIIRKQRFGRSHNSKMSEVVSEVIKREKTQKQRKQYPMTLYRRSYEVCVLCNLLVCSFTLPFEFKLKFVSKNKIIGIAEASNIWV